MEAIDLGPHFGVVARDAGVGGHDVTLGETADNDRAFAQFDALTIGKDQSADASTGVRHRSAGDCHLPGTQFGARFQGDRDGSDEAVTLESGVFAQVGSEFEGKGFFDGGEARVILFGQSDGEVIWHDDALDAERAVIVKLANEASANLDGL